MPFASKNSRKAALVREVLEAVEADHLAVAGSPGVRLDDQVGGAARGVEGDVLVQGVELQAAVGQRHHLAAAARAVLGGEEKARHPRGRLVDDGQLAEAAGVPEPRDARKLGVHLQPHGAAGEEEVVEAGLRPPRRHRPARRPTCRAHPAFRGGPAGMGQAS